MLNNNLYIIKNIRLFPKDVMRDMLEKGERLFFEKGEHVIIPGMLMQSVYLIEAGNASVYKLHIDGKECILGLVSPREFVNLIDIFSGKETTIFCKALTDLSIVKIPKQEIITIVNENPTLAINLLHFFSERYQEVIEVLEQVAYGKVEERLIFLLRKLADPLEGDGDWYPLPVSITHRDLAGMIASTRETVTLLLNKLRQENIIRIDNNRIWIYLDETRLKEFNIC
ncbi:Crp/Fnr family transcriptional regulator [Desulfosporosinus fructosivorans]|uniref:Crp/Fnr family transcriptional regulator n=1 Tax=Desulfosporosinus fructosivorans TaxID=2018669 RepID=A0A4Z0R0W2_9FIRM|nr:Crp/Fnr family transcriptional regulator [Desulfosporosinus fructosivorans]TGE35617.1 Crp/Fnr family transcriptional regulator [Desulfosporosinus fructosivorans]